MFAFLTKLDFNSMTQNNQSANVMQNQTEVKVATRTCLKDGEGISELVR